MGNDMVLSFNRLGVLERERERDAWFAPGYVGDN
jgi:hypothetical protein